MKLGRDGYYHAILNVVLTPEQARLVRIDAQTNEEFSPNDALVKCLYRGIDDLQERYAAASPGHADRAR